MDERVQATEHRLQRWAGRMQERQESGESIEVFCRTRGISRPTFFYWQRKLREAASTVSTVERAEISSEEKALVPKGWAVCEVATPERKNTLTVEIGPCRIIVESGTDMELLRQVCQKLVVLC